MRRLTYLTVWRKACPFVQALLQAEGRVHPWVRSVTEDLVQLQRETPKPAGLPRPGTDIEAWGWFAIGHPGPWPRFVRALRSLASPVGACLRVACPVCGLVVSSRGLGMHLLRRHQRLRLARFLFPPGSGVCPVCSGVLFTRLRCMHHVEYYMSACLSALRRGERERLPNGVLFNCIKLMLHVA